MCFGRRLFLLFGSASHFSSAIYDSFFFFFHSLICQRIFIGVFMIEFAISEPISKETERILFTWSMLSGNVNLSFAQDFWKFNFRYKWNHGNFSIFFFLQAFYDFPFELIQNEFWIFWFILSKEKKKITSSVNLWSYLKLTKSSIFTVVYWVLSHQTTSRYKFTECEKKNKQNAHYFSFSLSFFLRLQFTKSTPLVRREKKVTNYSRRTWKYSMISTLSFSVCCIHPSIYPSKD